MLPPLSPVPFQHSHSAGSASATQWSGTDWHTSSGTGMERLGTMRCLIKPRCAKKPRLPPRPYQLWTGQMWLLDSAMAYLEARQQQGYHSHPPPCIPIPCQHPEQPQGLAARAEDIQAFTACQGPALLLWHPPALQSRKKKNKCMSTCSAELPLPGPGSPALYPHPC